MIKDAWMSRPLKKDIIECLACCHKCKIATGKSGICGIRKNENGKLKLLVYGQAGTSNIDPIEKKPLFHFHPGIEIFSFGTVGCNFKCNFCQNWNLAQFHKTHTEEEIINAGTKLLPVDIINVCKKNNITAIAFTYNEPGVFFEYAYDTAKLAHENDIKTVYVSNGFETKEALAKIQPYLDAINIDIKSFRNEFYKKICGGRIEPIKENIKMLWDEGIWVEVTTLVITNENDSAKELREIAEFLCSISPDIPWHISRYFPCYQMNNPPTSIAKLEEAYEIGKKAGLNYVYIGNADIKKSSNTYCPQCHELLIERTGYLINKKSLTKEEVCINCNKNIAGKF